MSIPAGKTSYFGRFEDPEKFRLINQAGTRVRMLKDLVGAHYNSSWDMNASPFDGTMYISPTDETKGSCQHTRLVSYNHAEDKFDICFKAEELVLPHDLQEPITKLHTSINFMPDGSIIATTHNSSGPKHHLNWMPLAHVEHPWDGFPGSNVLHYDPKTGKSENYGVPVPRESIYGSCYDPKYNALYMIGFRKGHVYRLGLDDRKVKDLGKQAEIFNYRLHLAPDGHIYGMTKSGFLYRINVDTQELEDMNWSLPRYRYDDCNNTWYRYMCDAVNIDDHRFLFATNSSQTFFIFDCNTLTVTPTGKRCPFDYTSDFHIANMSLDEITIDKYGVLWYALHGRPQQPIKDDFYHYPCPQFLIRYDFQNGKEAECLGIIGTVDYNTPSAYCMTMDKVNDVLYMEGAGYGPRGVDDPEQKGLGIFMLDLKEFRPHMYEKGPQIPIEATPYTDEEVEQAKAYVKGWAGEEVSSANPTTIFSIDKVTPIRLWRHVPTDNINGSKVIGLAWDDKGNLHGTCGKDGKAEYAFKIVPQDHIAFPSKEAAYQDEKFFTMESIYNGSAEMPTWTDENGQFCVATPQSFRFKLEYVKPIDQMCECCMKWLNENQLPQPVNVDASIKLPSVMGRRYLATASATTPWKDGFAVGTFDSMFAIVNGDNKVHAYGNAAPCGAIRCMCTNAAGTKIYGVAGHDYSMGTVFSYDEEEGLQQLGLVNYNSPGYLDGPSASNILSSITLSKDEKYLAVGGADRIGAIHIFKL